jgi:hypothetical protein
MAGAGCGAGRLAWWELLAWREARQRLRFEAETTGRDVRCPQLRFRLHLFGQIHRLPEKLRVFEPDVMQTVGKDQIADLAYYLAHFR